MKAANDNFDKHFHFEMLKSHIAAEKIAVENGWQFSVWVGPNFGDH